MSVPLRVSNSKAGQVQDVPDSTRPAGELSASKELSDLGPLTFQTLTCSQCSDSELMLNNSLALK